MGNSFKRPRKKPKKKPNRNKSLTEFNWTLVKQQLELAKLIGSFSRAKLVDIKLKIVNELKKLDGIESTKTTFINSGLLDFNENLLTVVCSTCFSETEQEEVVCLLLETDELVTIDDLYCGIFEAISYKIVGLMIDKYVNLDNSTSQNAKKFGLIKGQPGEYSLLDVYIHRFKLFHEVFTHDLVNNFCYQRLRKNLLEYQYGLFKLIHHGFKLARIDYLDAEMHNLESPISYHCGMFNLMLFVNKHQLAIDPGEVDLFVQLDNHLCEITLKRIQRLDLEDVTKSPWLMLYQYVSESDRDNFLLLGKSETIEDCLQPLKKRYFETIYRHIIKSPLSLHLSDSNRTLLTRLVIENNGIFQPLSLSDFCRKQLILKPDIFTINLPNRIRQFLKYQDEINDHFQYFLLL